MSYPIIEHVLKIELKKYPNHDYHYWKNKAPDCKKSMLLQNLELFLEILGDVPKSIRKKLGNPKQFVDTYYELEVAVF